MRTSPSLASFWTSWVTLPLETSRARERAHRHAVGMAVQSGEHVEARERGAVPGEAALNVLLDRHRAGE